MKATEIKDLISGLLVVVLIAFALGQFRSLEEFARREARRALRVEGTAKFFRH